jgi:hypothetical protein
LDDIKMAASDGVNEQLNRGNVGTVRQTEAPKVPPEQLIVTPQRSRPPLTKIAARVGGTNGIPAYVHVDRGANVGMMDLLTTEKAGHSSQIKHGKPSFSNTADGKMATGLGWLDHSLEIRHFCS